MNIKPSVFLVTGCAGFIGSRITKLLVERGDIVIGVDNLSNSYAPQFNEWRLEQLKQLSNFHFHKYDITDINKIRDLFRQYKFDAIIHLAARTGVRASIEDPWIYIKTNIDGTLNLLELCREFNVNKFVLASTSSIYGKNSIPFNEDSKADCQISPYASSKKGAEALAYTYHYLYGVDLTILRYFTVYGPLGRPDIVIFKFIHRIFNNLTIAVYGDGTQERDFTYIDDIAYGTIAALKKLGFEVINLGSDRPVKLSYVIELMEKYLGKKAKIEYHPFHPADAYSTWADISKAKKLLNWYPQINIEEGVKRTVLWYKQNQDWIRKIKILNEIVFGVEH